MQSNIFNTQQVYLAEILGFKVCYNFQAKTKAYI